MPTLESKVKITKWLCDFAASSPVHRYAIRWIHCCEYGWMLHVDKQAKSPFQILNELNVHNVIQVKILTSNF